MYKSIFISDIHLGSPYSKSRELFSVLENIESEKIFLIGDIINASTPYNHPDVVKFITLINAKDWKIIYIEGNHEEDRVNFPPVSLSFKKALFPKKNYIYNNIYIEHGHSFHKKNLFNIWLNRFAIYLKSKIVKAEKRDNRERVEKRSRYHSIVKPLAQKILIYSFQSYMVSCAKKNGCKMVICGHFHTPQNKIIKGIDYLNCGDWIENKSLIVEDMDGKFSLINATYF